MVVHFECFDRVIFLLFIYEEVYQDTLDILEVHKSVNYVSCDRERALSLSFTHYSPFSNPRNSIEFIHQKNYWFVQN